MDRVEFYKQQIEELEKVIAQMERREFTLFKQEMNGPQIDITAETVEHDKRILQVLRDIVSRG